MPITRPELADLRDEAMADIERLLGADARLKMGNLAVIAYMTAGGVDGLYGYLEYLSKQILPDTAEDEFLERHASLKRMVRRAATAARGELVVSGAPGAVIPAGTQFVRRDGVVYSAEAEFELVQTSASIDVVCDTLGAIGNTPEGTVLTCVVPVPGLGSSAIVGVSGITNGTERETIESLRRRLLKRLASPIKGGAIGDYESWALEVPGVTRAWESPLEMGAGTITLRFVRDDDPDPIPDDQAIAVVKNYLDQRRSVTSELYVVPPIPVALNFVINVEPDSAAVRAAVEMELRDLIKRNGSPGSTLLISHIREAISIAAGEHDHVLTAPVANVAHPIGHMPVMGAITWQ